LQDCPPETLVNAFDNTIAYTDRLLAKAIGWLQSRGGSNEPALLYVSDHGESLGENNLYLHGLPYAIAPREQKQVPLVFWSPAGSAAPERLDPACLRARLDVPLSHDHLFHTVLGLLGVQADEYRPELDPFAPCAQP